MQYIVTYIDETTRKEYEAVGNYDHEYNALNQYVVDSKSDLYACAVYYLGLYCGNNKYDKFKELCREGYVDFINKDGEEATIRMMWDNGEEIGMVRRMRLTF